MNATPPIFVISLVREAGRRAEMIRRLDADNLRYEIVDGVDGAVLNREEYAGRLGQYHRREGSCFRLNHSKRRFAGRLSPGEIGCYLSHYNLWRRIADEKIPAAVILEDDAAPEADFAAVVREIAASGWRWDLIYLHRDHSDKIYRVLQTVGGGRRLAQLKITPNAAGAYMISAAGAEKLLRHCWFMHHGLDVVWKDFWNWDGRVYAVCPNPVRQLTPPSAINHVNEILAETPHLAAQTSPSVLVRRVLRKWKISAIKRWHYWRFRPERESGGIGE
ncbi:MAG: glycosyltransferase family 25 protein [Gammaproteobacteria bacterium]